MRQKDGVLQRLAGGNNEGIAGFADFDGFDRRFDALQDVNDADAERKGTDDIVLVHDRFKVRHVVDAVADDEAGIVLAALDGDGFRALLRQRNAGLALSGAVFQEGRDANHLVADTHHDGRVGM